VSRKGRDVNVLAAASVLCLVMLAIYVLIILAAAGEL
jgi:hypothetical protein